MAKTTSTTVPSDLAALERRFAQWRSCRESRRIPEDLWARAVAAARKHGAWQTSRVLRLNRGNLSRRMATSSSAASSEESVKSRPSPSFVELPLSAAPPACVLEVTSPRGVRLRLEVQAEALASVGSMLRPRGAR